MYNNMLCGYRLVYRGSIWGFYYTKMDFYKPLSIDYDWIIRIEMQIVNNNNTTETEFIQE